MIVSDFLTLYHVDVMNASCSDLASPNLRGACTTTGGGHHGYALAIIGAIVLVMTWGAAVGGSRPAGIALLALGAAGLAIALAIDRPDVHKTGIVGSQFSSARANPGAAFRLELVGASLVLAAGLLAALRPSRR
jgi:hypothetical protein